MQYSYIFEIIRESGVRLRGERQKKILGLNSFDEVYCYGTRVRTTYSTATLSAVIHFFFFFHQEQEFGVCIIYYFISFLRRRQPQQQGQIPPQLVYTQSLPIISQQPKRNVI